jgi:hypothetical protein
MRLKSKYRWSQKMEDKLLHFWMQSTIPAHKIAQRISFECGIKPPLTACAVIGKANRLTKGRELSYADRKNHVA